MKKAFFITLLMFFIVPSILFGWNQSFNLNIGSTGVLDGILPPPGWYSSNYIKYYHSEKFYGLRLPGYTESPKKWIIAYSNHGDSRWKDPNKGFAKDSRDRIDISGVVLQLVYVSKKKIRGKLTPGFQAILPIYSFNIESDVFDFVKDQSGRSVVGASGVGDLCFGPLLGFPTFKVGPLQVHSFFEFDTYFPIGRYNSHRMINPGAHHFIIEPWIAFTVLFPYNFEISMRHHYTYNTENHNYRTPIFNLKEGKLVWKKLDMKPGQMWHFNYTLTKQIGKNPFFRVGIAGYYLRQFTDDKLEGKKIKGSKEEAFSIGPVISYQTKTGVILTAKTVFETHVENRPKGILFVGRIIFRF